MITIIDYGMGNLRSVQKAFQHINIEAVSSSDPATVAKADKLLLPGVGHFANGMKRLKETGLLEVLNQKVLIEKTPVLGICLGMQLMTSHSEEGDVEGLNWVSARTRKFRSEGLKIPHMGWNNVHVAKPALIAEGINDSNMFYFVHSYYVSCEQSNDVLFETTYGDTFVSGFQKENITGVQFHPEKSYKSGFTLLKNFATAPCSDQE